MEDKTIKTLEIVIGILIIYMVYKFFLSIGQKLNIIDDEQDVAATSLVEDKGNIFSPNYWKNKKNAKVLTTSSARALAKNLYDASGVFNDNEEAVYGVFRQLNYKTQVSWLSYIFYKQYGEDMLQYLKSFMNNDELATLKQITDKLK